MKPEDPVSRGAERAIDHLNEDHADALLEMAQAFGGQPEATAARCLDADRTGLDLIATTAAGEVPVRVPYEEPIDEPAGLRKATVKLAHSARAALEAR
jgi:heme iron utilization protein